MNRKKIINDPVYGFITVPFTSAQNIIDHPWFQRLTRIRQLGLTSLVYPGALHTRFHHALGAMHLMGSAIETLRSKGHKISDDEAEAATLAILLHDIGHGPFSHALEKLLIPVTHEYLSSSFMKVLDKEFGGVLHQAIGIFNNTHPKKYLNQLVSSQLDVDRLDYLNRDSFFTGVSEGVISSERIIRMLDIHDGNLVVEEKGLYSVENFIVARRLMYWQVYLHKTVLAAEHMLINIIGRAKELTSRGYSLFASEPLSIFLKGSIKESDFQENDLSLRKFSLLDDFDVLSAVKEWSNHADPVLSYLCKCLINRNLYKIEISKEPFEENKLLELRHKFSQLMEIDFEDSEYLVFSGNVWNNAYKVEKNNINILFRDGTVMDIANASDNLNISALTATVTKYFLCTPRLQP